MVTPTTNPVPSDSPSDLLFNAQKIDQAVNSGLLLYTDRLGVPRRTVAGAIASIAAITNRGAWTTATAYAARDVVQVSGTWYIAITNHTSGATFAGDLAANWRVYQGVVQAELSSAIDPLLGAAQVGFGSTMAYAAGTIGAALRAFYNSTGVVKPLRVDAGGGPSIYTLARYLANESVTDHAHYAFLDDSEVVYAGGAPIYGHASFNSNVKFTGSVASDHHHSFQSYPHYGTSATIARIVSFYSIGETTAGTVTEFSHFRADNPIGSGTITTHYGLYLATLTRGGTNWGVFVQSNDSFFGGLLKLGASGVPWASIEYSSLLGHLLLRPRPGFGVKIGGGAGDRVLRLGVFNDDSFDATIENTGGGDLAITARSGFAVAAMSPLRLPSYPVASLPAAAAFQYSRAFASDATATTFNSVVAGGGANKVPVWSDGTNWRIG